MEHQKIKFFVILLKFIATLLIIYLHLQHSADK